MRDAELWRLRQPGSEVFSLLPVDLSESLKFLPANTTALILSEHGHSDAIGNVNRSSLRAIDWLPSFLVYDSCLTGAWGYSDSPEQSLLNETFLVKKPPVAVMASQGVKWLPIYGATSENIPETFLNSWPQGESLGEHLTRQVNLNLSHWRSHLVSENLYEDFVAQIFQTLAVFGDASLEN